MKTSPVPGPGCALPWQCSWENKRAAGVLLRVEKDGFAHGDGFLQVLLKRQGKTWPPHVFQVVQTESSGIEYYDSQSCHKDQKTWIPSAGRRFHSPHFLHACSSLGFTCIQIPTAQIDHTRIKLLPLT